MDMATMDLAPNSQFVELELRLEALEQVARVIADDQDNVPQPLGSALLHLLARVQEAAADLAPRPGGRT